MAVDVSDHYLGEKGRVYFAVQSLYADINGAIEARKFAPFVTRDSCVIDFGCGTGSTLANLRCARRIGIEVNPVAQRATIARGIDCYPESGCLPPQIADFVISNHALEHVLYPLQVLKDFRRLLKIGGQLLLVLPIDDWRTQRFFDEEDIHHHLYTWTPQLIGNCLVEAGFKAENISARVLTSAWFPGYRRAFMSLPDPIFALGCKTFSVLRKRRQLMATAQA